MREIKFEYGFESNNGILKKKYFLHEIPHIRYKCDLWDNYPIAYVRMFTGLKDKNGVEIYEFDVDNLGRVVTYSRGSFCLFFEGKEDWCFLSDAAENITIQGNVFEHKHLLQ